LILGIAKLCYKIYTRIHKHARTHTHTISHPNPHTHAHLYSVFKIAGKLNFRKVVNLLYTLFVIQYSPTMYNACHKYIARSRIVY